MMQPRLRCVRDCTQWFNNATHGRPNTSGGEPSEKNSKHQSGTYGEVDTADSDVHNLVAIAYPIRQTVLKSRWEADCLTA